MPVAAEVAKACKRWHFDDYLLLHDAAAGASGAAQRERTGGGQEEVVVAMGKSGVRWWRWGVWGGKISFVAIVSENMGKGDAKLGSNLRKQNRPD